MNTITFPKAFKPSSTEAVQFKDGMLVTAEDLTAATQYPLSVMQVLIRAYFGCGVVCGFGLEPVGAPQQEGPAVKPTEPSFVIRIDRGVALDCHGLPIELCGPLKLDLSPDPCLCGPPPEELCVAVRRITSAEAPRRGGGCCSDDRADQQCSRRRDHVLVQAFRPNELPEVLCRRPRRDPVEDRGYYEGEEPPVESPDLCDCLKSCPPGDCCGDAWVLLGCVMLGESGIGRIDDSVRRYVKPIECLCGPGTRAPGGSAPEPETGDKVDPARERYETDRAAWSKRIEDLGKQVAAQQSTLDEMKAAQERLKASCDEAGAAVTKEDEAWAKRIDALAKEVEKQKQGLAKVSEEYEKLKTSCEAPDSGGKGTVTVPVLRDNLTALDQRVTAQEARITEVQTAQRTPVRTRGTAATDRTKEEPPAEEK